MAYPTDGAYTHHPTEGYNTNVLRGHHVHTQRLELIPIATARTYSFNECTRGTQNAKTPALWQR